MYNRSKRKKKNKTKNNNNNKKKKRNYSNTNYRTEIELVPIIMDYCKLQFHALNFFTGELTGWLVVGLSPVVRLWNLGL